MKLYECGKCARRYFEKRAVCPNCFTEEIRNVEVSGVEELVTSELKVTPIGFEESYDLVLGKCGGAGIIIRKEDR